MSGIRWGVLGAAHIATTKVIPGIQKSATGRVVALASRDREKAELAAGELGIARTHTDYEALLADPQVDAVYIPLPNHLHAPWVMAAAEAGKHVLCEKPLAMNQEEAGQVVDACERAGVLLMEAFMYRLHPLWLDVVDVVRSGAIGALRAVQTVFSFHNDDPGNIRNQLAAGGGAMMDIGCYAVNVSRLLFDSEPVTIDALVVRDPASGVDVSTSALLGFDGGHAGFTVSIRSEPAQHVTVLGERGRIEVPIPFNIPEDVPTRFELVRGGDPPVAPGIEEHVFEPRNQYSAEADAFARAIIDGTAVPTDPADAVANMTVIDAVLR